MLCAQRECSATWLQEVDAAVNTYPGERTFTAIGEGTQDFKQSMVQCVEDGLQRSVHPEAVKVRASVGNKYFSVKIGPVVVQDPDEVIAVYTNMKKDGRMRWFI
jgi:putative lipoic acid-binding regulatory protein